jgi:hypothetical protein
LAVLVVSYVMNQTLASVLKVFGRTAPPPPSKKSSDGRIASVTGNKQ